MKFGFRENLILALLLLFAGIFFEFISDGMRFNLPQYPLNVVFVLVFISVIIFLHFKYYKHWLIIWFSNIPSAIIAIVMITILSLTPSLFLHGESANYEWYSFLSFSHIQNSLLFIILELYILAALGFVTLRKCNFMSSVDIGLFIFHLGLWIFLAAFITGASDLKQGEINLLKDGYPIDVLKLSNGDISRLPFAMKLIDLKLVSSKKNIKIFNDTLIENNNLKCNFNEQCIAFHASLEIMHENEASDTINILTNHPIHLEGWTFSLIGFDKSKGRLSSLCILKVIKDPWIFVVYIGGILMFLGISVYCIFNKKLSMIN